MSTLLNAAPKFILAGVNDESGGTLPVVPEQIPTHLPHIFLYAEQGPLDPQLVSGGSFTRMYGSKTLDMRSKYANHQSVLAQVVNGNGNAMMIQRLKPEDANGPSTLQLALEVVATEVTEYTREVDGSLSYDVNGDPIPTGNTVPGYEAKWHLGQADAAGLGQAVTLTGDMVGSAAQESTIYPIMELEVSSFGEHGNRKGVRLWAPTTRSTSPASDEIVRDQNAFLYRMQMIERPDTSSTPNLVETISGSQAVEFSFKEGALNTKTDTELFVDQILLDAYRDLDTAPKQYGPFNALHVYHDNLQTVLDLVFATEQPHQPDWPTDVAEGRHLVNLVGGENIDGRLYYTYRILGKIDGGIELTPSSNHYAAGGSDGTMSLAAFDASVASAVSAAYVRDTGTQLDDAVYSQSVVYDTGFSLETKKKLLLPLASRKDMMVVLSTQDVTQPQNTAEQESSMAIALRAAARVYPESEVFGTSVCRAVVVGHSGYMVNSQYKGLLPLTIELANKASSFMGGGDGIWKRNRGFDVAPYNQITQFKPDTVNCTYKQASVYARDWDAGLVWVQNFDRNSLFFPAVQTVYDDPTSVLNSLINAFVVVEVEKVCQRVWRQLVGTSKLTDDQFIEKSDELISELTDGRFDDRVTVVPRTYYTSTDAALGYSWSTDVELYLNNMKSVGRFTITARRSSDLQAA